MEPIIKQNYIVWLTNNQNLSDCYFGFIFFDLKMIFIDLDGSYQGVQAFHGELF